jgi:hypothetical protein
MRTKLTTVLLLAGAVGIAFGPGCKAKENPSEGEAITTPPVTDPTPTPEPPAIDAQGPAQLGETPTILLDSTSTSEATWTVTDTEIRIRASFAQGSESAAKRDAAIFATVGESPEAEVFACKKMLMEGKPRIEALLRGDNVHLLCINPPLGESTGFTDGMRLGLDPAKMTLAETGSYGGEGIVDPDTIDLDEGEGEL